MTRFFVVVEKDSVDSFSFDVSLSLNYACA